MTNDTTDIIYNPGDVALQLNIKESTLRKYSILLEKAGYIYSKNGRGQRGYTDTDMIVLRRLIDLKSGDMSLERAAYTVTTWAKKQDIAVHDTETERYNKQDIEELKDLIKEQSETISKQSEFMKELARQLEQQREYIDKSMRERDQTLLHAIEERLETQKQIAAAEEEKKGFFNKLFRK